jgi:N-sulfoglucosamine sulfohydrolase
MDSRRFDLGYTNSRIHQLGTMLLLMAAGWFLPRASAVEPVRRSILILVADDIGLDCGCYGNNKIKTPNIDALAANGVCFTHGFACVSSCSPSRASIYTGLHTHTSGQYGLAQPPHNQSSFSTVQSLPRVLRAAGYRTGIIGKLHVQPREVYPFEVELSDKETFGNRDVGLLGRRARQFFSDCGDNPFLLVMAFGDPHRTTEKGFGNENQYEGVPETRYEPKDVIVPWHLPDRPEVRQELAEYYQSSSRMDYGVGLVLKALKETKKDEETLIFFVSDNGIPFPGAKTTLYDPGLHLPFLVSSPTLKKRGLRNDAMVSFVDIMPTALDWAGVKPPEGLQGRSLLPILEEAHPKGWDVVYGSHQMHEATMYYPMRMVRTRTHKYILNLAHPLEYPIANDIYRSPTWQGILKRGDKTLGERDLNGYLHRPREELYDLEKDPHELKNVAADPAYQKVLADLRSRLKEWQSATKDRWQIKYEHE